MGAVVDTPWSSDKIFFEKDPYVSISTTFISATLKQNKCDFFFFPIKESRLKKEKKKHNNTGNKLVSW